MQYLKEEIKNNILTAALKEFEQKGFMEASVRTIAKNAGVALGNVYRYFKNKEELFNTIIEPAYNNLITQIPDIGKTSSARIYKDNIFPSKYIIGFIMEVFNKYSTQLLIMIDKSKGSKFENAKQELIDLVNAQFKNEFLPELKENGIKLKDEYITYVIASSFVEGFFIILRKHKDKEKIEYLVNQLLRVFFENFVDRFK